MMLSIREIELKHGGVRTRAEDAMLEEEADEVSSLSSSSTTSISSHRSIMKMQPMNTRVGDTKYYPMNPTNAISNKKEQLHLHSRLNDSIYWNIRESDMQQALLFDPIRTKSNPMDIFLPCTSSSIGKSQTEDSLTNSGDSIIDMNSFYRVDRIEKKKEAKRRIERNFRWKVYAGYENEPIPTLLRRTLSYPDPDLCCDSSSSTINTSVHNLASNSILLEEDSESIGVGPIAAETCTDAPTMSSQGTPTSMPQERMILYCPSSPLKGDETKHILSNPTDTTAASSNSGISIDDDNDADARFDSPNSSHHSVSSLDEPLHARAFSSMGHRCEIISSPSQVTRGSSLDTLLDETLLPDTMDKSSHLPPIVLTSAQHSEINQDIPWIPQMTYEETCKSPEDSEPGHIVSMAAVFKSTHSTPPSLQSIPSLDYTCIHHEWIGSSSHPEVTNRMDNPQQDETEKKNIECTSQNSCTKNENERCFPFDEQDEIGKSSSNNGPIDTHDDMCPHIVKDVPMVVQTDTTQEDCVSDLNVWIGSRHFINMSTAAPMEEASHDTNELLNTMTRFPQESVCALDWTDVDPKDWDVDSSTWIDPGPSHECNPESSKGIQNLKWLDSDMDMYGFPNSSSQTIVHHSPSDHTKCIDSQVKSEIPLKKFHTSSTCSSVPKANSHSRQCLAHLKKEVCQSATRDLQFTREMSGFTSHSHSLPHRQHCAKSQEDPIQYKIMTEDDINPKNATLTKTIRNKGRSGSSLNLFATKERDIRKGSKVNPQDRTRPGGLLDSSSFMIRDDARPMDLHPLLSNTDLNHVVRRERVKKSGLNWSRVFSRNGVNLSLDKLYQGKAIQGAISSFKMSTIMHVNSSVQNTDLVTAVSAT